MSNLSDTLQAALNGQLNRELYSAHLYLSMSAYFQSRSLRGFAHWMTVQHAEETSHALKIVNFISDRNGRVALGSLDQPPVEFESVQEVMELSLAHERELTESISDLYRIAQSEKDYPTHVLLEWFVEEQIEEEKTIVEICDHLELIGDDGTGLLLLDARLGDRQAS